MKRFIFLILISMIAMAVQPAVTSMVDDDVGIECSYDNPDMITDISTYLITGSQVLHPDIGEPVVIVMPSDKLPGLAPQSGFYVYNNYLTAKHAILARAQQLDQLINDGKMTPGPGHRCPDRAAAALHYDGKIYLHDNISKGYVRIVSTCNGGCGY